MLEVAFRQNRKTWKETNYIYCARNLRNVGGFVEACPKSSFNHIIKMQTKYIHINLTIYERYNMCRMRAYALVLWHIYLLPFCWHLESSSVSNIILSLSKYNCFEYKKCCLYIPNTYINVDYSILSN